VNKPAGDHIIPQIGSIPIYIGRKREIFTAHLAYAD
jgi:hypothetical protein